MAHRVPTSTISYIDEAIPPACCHGSVWVMPVLCWGPTTVGMGCRSRVGLLLMVRARGIHGVRGPAGWGVILVSLRFHSVIFCFFLFFSSFLFFRLREVTRDKHIAHVVAEHS